MADKESDRKPRARSTAELQAEIDEARERLVANLGQLKEETKPKALADKAMASAKGAFIDAETGAVRVERVAIVVGSVVGLVLLRRGVKARARHKQMKRLAEIVWVPVPKATVSKEIAPFARTAAEVAPRTDVLDLRLPQIDQQLV